MSKRTAFLVTVLLASACALVGCKQFDNGFTVTPSPIIPKTAGAQ